MIAVTWTAVKLIKDDNT